MSRKSSKGNAQGRRSSVPDGYTTKQVARLARVRLGRILFELGTTGNWRGVEPVSRRPLIWPRQAISSVLSRAPERELMTPGEQVLCDLLFESGLDLDRFWPLVMLLLAKPDPGRDPAYAFDDLNMLIAIARAVMERLDVSWPMLDSSQKARGERSLSYMASLLDGFTTDEKPRSNNNENN